ncbi:MAG: type II toxin-antitoxin system RelE/ParE family toxin [Bacteroidetes bacterium]|nr:type II toxin-antitoxin system RelE/ParE family toxin [Bacteroidota bacterium]
MVKGKAYKIIWADLAKEQLKDIYKYIKKDSEQNAKKVRSAILVSTAVLETGKEIYKAAQLKINNKGNYRAYIIYSYRITYKIEVDTIEILRVRHTSREPLEH